MEGGGRKGVGVIDGGKVTLVKGDVLNIIFFKKRERERSSFFQRKA